MAVAGALATASAITLSGVIFFFQPVAESDTATGIAPLPAPVAFLIYVGLCVALFDWLALQMRSATKAAFALATSQFVLVVDLTLRGERGFVTLIASGVLLAATWSGVAYVYSRLSLGGGK
jgi:hypothetical protein